MKLIYFVPLLVLVSLVASVPTDFKSIFKKEVHMFVKDLQEGFKSDRANFVKDLKAFYDVFPLINKSSIEDGSVKADDLVPTQNEINLKNSLQYIANTPENVTKYLDCKDPVTVKENLLVAKINNVYYILDGHHRWSQVYLVNKECKIKAYIVSGFTNISTALKTAHLAIASLLGPTKNEYPVSVVPEEDKDFNILGSSQTCKDTVNKWLKDTYIVKCLGEYKKKDTSLDEEKLFANLTIILNRMREHNSPNIGLSAPERKYMPQADQSEGGLSATVNALRVVSTNKKRKLK